MCEGLVNWLVASGITPFGAAGWFFAIAVTWLYYRRGDRVAQVLERSTEAQMKVAQTQLAHSQTLTTLNTTVAVMAAKLGDRQ